MLNKGNINYTVYNLIVETEKIGVLYITVGVNFFHFVASFTVWRME